MGRNFSLIAIIILLIVGCAASKIFTSHNTTETKAKSTGSEITLASTFAPETTETSSETRLAAFMQHSHRNGAPGAPWVVSFQETGTRTPVEEILPGTSIAAAASAYAVYSTDYDVSLRDIIDSGFWPFNGTFDEQDLDSRLYGFNLLPGMATGDDYRPCHRYDLGSDEWLIVVKHDILKRFYWDYYYSPELTEQKNEMITDIIPSFWYNHLQDRPMESTDAEGDIRSRALSDFSHPWYHLDFDYDLEVLDIRPVKPQSSNNDEANATSNEAKATSSTQ